MSANAIRVGPAVLLFRAAIIRGAWAADAVSAGAARIGRAFTISTAKLTVGAVIMAVAVGLFTR